MPFAMEIQQVVCGTRHHGRHVGRLPTEPHERRRDHRIGAGGAPWQHLVTQEIAGPGGVGVACILPPLLGHSAEECPHGIPGRIEQGSQEGHALAELTGPRHPG